MNYDVNKKVKNFKIIWSCFHFINLIDLLMLLIEFYEILYLLEISHSGPSNLIHDKNLLS